MLLGRPDKLFMNYITEASSNTITEGVAVRHSVTIQLCVLAGYCYDATVFP